MSQTTEYTAHQGFRIAALSRASITPTPDGQVQGASSVAYFPFTKATIEKLLLGTSVPEPLLKARAKLLDAWKGVMAVARGNEILLLQTSLREPLVPKGKKLLDPKESLQCLAWAIDPQTFGPLLLFAGEQALIYAWDPTSNKMKGIMRGHGGPIYDITVLSTNPFIFASASRDRSVRVYDLTLQASSTLLEAGWPITATTPRSESDKGGRRGRGQLEPLEMIGAVGGPLGSQVSSSVGGEGVGLGKCFLILRGSSKGSGGHIASVLAVAFHYSEPFVATAGVDNCVKIWWVPEIRALAAPRRLVVQDKPVFSSSCVHESYVTSIYWLSPDVLVSKSCGPNATVVVWKWLELQRFSPKDLNAPVRHLPSDYNGSRSFTILARSPVAAFGGEGNRLAFCPADSLAYQEAWIGLPSSKGDILLWEVSSIPPQPPFALPSRPDWKDEAKLLETSQNKAINVHESRSSSGFEEGDYSDTDQMPMRRKDRKGKLVVMSPPPDEGEQNAAKADLRVWIKEETPSWVPSARLSLNDAIDSLPATSGSQWSQGTDVQCLAFSPRGVQYIVGVGGGQTIAVWKRS